MLVYVVYDDMNDSGPSSPSDYVVIGVVSSPEKVKELFGDRYSHYDEYEIDEI